jgi:Holliday junction resolvase RusA-like endonuclease
VEAVERCKVNSEGFVIVPIVPMGAVRLSSSDRWAKRPIAVKYFEWKNEFKLIMAQSAELRNVLAKIFESGRMELITKHELPETWSKKKKAENYGQPMRAKPDWDNCGKGICDVAFKEDSFIYRGIVEQRWCNEGESPCVMIKEC